MHQVVRQQYYLRLLNIPVWQQRVKQIDNGAELIANHLIADARVLFVYAEDTPNCTAIQSLFNSIAFAMGISLDKVSYCIFDTNFGSQLNLDLIDNLAEINPMVIIYLSSSESLFKKENAQFRACDSIELCLNGSLLENNFEFKKHLMAALMKKDMIV